MKIVISSGHGKKIRGASGYLDEVDEARRVVERVANYLSDEGVDVVTYHDDISTSQNENLNRIVDFHNSQPRSLDISVHFNAYETTSKPMGTECLYVSQSKLAADVALAISDAGDFLNRGPKKRTDLFFLNNTEEPAILIETCFVDSKADADLYNKNFDHICGAIAAAVVGEEVESAPPVSEVEPPLPSEPPSLERRTLKEGMKGDDVLILQKALGVLDADGDFGSITDTWVRAFQAACGLDDVDGIVGEQSWDQVDDLLMRLDDGEDRLPKQLADQIYTLAQESEIADYSWPDRGYPPPGYIAGMALCFAYAMQDDEMMKHMGGPLGSTDKDALAWYADEFAQVGMKNDGSVQPIDRLRHLFVMQIGLGLRESSGIYVEGRDLTADNVESITAEASLFQTSWNISSASSAIPPLLNDFWENPNGFLSVFKEGISPTSNNLSCYGSGDGVRYQFLSRFAPLFHVLVTAVGMRVLRQHWGPINRKEVTLRKEADVMLKGVQELVEQQAVA